MWCTIPRTVRSPLCSVVSHFSKSARKKIPRESTIYEVTSDTGLKKGQQAYVFGYSATGALGIERLVVSADRNAPPVWGLFQPAVLKDLTNPLHVACGFGFSVYICRIPKQGRVVYGCGLNSDGQLGPYPGLAGQLNAQGHSVQVHVIPSPQPIALPLSTNDPDGACVMQPTHIGAGRAHTVIAMQPSEDDAKGNHLARPFLFTLGNNAYGQCGRQIIPNEVFGPDVAPITRVTLPPEVTGVKQVCCGQDHTLLLSTEGYVYAAGLGTDGQTGQGHFKSIDQFRPVGGLIRDVQIDQLASSGDTVLALSRCGRRLFAWGNNEYGQIWPVGDALQQPDPVELPLDRSRAISIGDDDSTTVRSVENPPGQIGRLSSIACAGSMCCVLDEDGQAFVWGFGCLGLGPRTTSAPLPTLIPPGLFQPAAPGTDQRLISLTSGLHHFIARNQDGQLWAWGAPRSGLYCLGSGQQLDRAATRQTYPVPVQISAQARQVGCGCDHTVVLTRMG